MIVHDALIPIMKLLVDGIFIELQYCNIKSIHTHNHTSICNLSYTFKRRLILVEFFLTRSLWIETIDKYFSLNSINETDIRKMDMISCATFNGYHDSMIHFISLIQFWSCWKSMKWLCYLNLAAKMLKLLSFGDGKKMKRFRIAMHYIRLWAQCNDVL